MREVGPARDLEAAGVGCLVVVCFASEGGRWGGGGGVMLGMFLCTSLFGDDGFWAEGGGLSCWMFVGWVCGLICLLVVLLVWSFVGLFVCLV